MAATGPPWEGNRWFATTRFRALERMRGQARFIVYPYYALLTIAFCWAAAHSESFSKNAADILGPPLQRSIAAVVFLTCLWWPVLLYGILHNPRRLLDRLAGRCLDCGNDRLLADAHSCCASCGSSLAFQEAYQRYVRAPDWRRARYRKLERAILFPTRRDRVLRVSGPILIVISLGLFTWVVMNDPSPGPNGRVLRTTDQIILATAATVMFCAGVIARLAWQVRRAKANAERMRGCCLYCEKPWSHHEDICTTCGCSRWRQAMTLRQLGFSDSAVRDFMTGSKAQGPVLVKKALDGAPGQHDGGALW